ncbi:hypothetical protein ACFLU6_07240 [Acidobacteriota bacterium]
MKDKNTVALHVAKDFMCSGTSVFLGDGSSTFYVGLQTLIPKSQITIWTNHIAFAHQFALHASEESSELRGTTVLLAGGEVDCDLMMTWGDKAEEFAEHYGGKAQNIILSVRCLFSDRGPAGMEQRSLSVKQAAIRGGLKKGVKVIFVADYTKLSTKYTKEPLLFPSHADWAQVISQDNVFVVTSGDPGADQRWRAVSSPNSPTQWYEHHRFILNCAMNTQGKPKRFIQV